MKLLKNTFSTASLGKIIAHFSTATISQSRLGIEVEENGAKIISATSPDGKSWAVWADEVLFETVFPGTCYYNF